MSFFLLAGVVALPILHFTVLTLYGDGLFGLRPFSRMERRLALLAAILLHAMFLVSWTLHWRVFPATSLAQVMSLVAFFSLASLGLAELRSENIRGGFSIIAVTFLLQLASSTLHQPPQVVSQLLFEPLFGLHVSFAFLGCCSLAVAAGLAALGRRQETTDAQTESQGLAEALRLPLIVSFASLNLSVLTAIVWLALPDSRGAVLKLPILFSVLAWSTLSLSLAAMRQRRVSLQKCALYGMVCLVTLLGSLVTATFLASHSARFATGVTGAVRAMAGVLNLR